MLYGGRTWFVFAAPAASRLCHTRKQDKLGSLEEKSSFKMPYSFLSADYDTALPKVDRGDVILLFLQTAVMALCYGAIHGRCISCCSSSKIPGGSSKSSVLLPVSVYTLFCIWLCSPLYLPTNLFWVSNQKKNIEIRNFFFIYWMNKSRIEESTNITENYVKMHSKYEFYVG